MWLQAHRELLSGLSADSVWQHLLRPLAERCNSSLAEALAGAADLAATATAGVGGTLGDGSGGGAGTPFAGRANVYVSYHGGMNFESIVDSLEEFEAHGAEAGAAGAGSCHSPGGSECTFYWFLPFCEDPRLEALHTAPPLWIRLVRAPALGMLLLTDTVTASGTYG